MTDLEQRLIEALLDLWNHRGCQASDRPAHLDKEVLDLLKECAVPSENVS